MTHKSYKCASEWLMHVAVCGIAGPPDQSSPSSGNKCRMARPLTMPNFIALGQTIYEKSVINFNHLWIVAPLWPKFANLGTDIVRDISMCEISSRSYNMYADTYISAKFRWFRWQRDRQTEKKSACLHEAIVGAIGRADQSPRRSHRVNTGLHAIVAALSWRDHRVVLMWIFINCCLRPS